MIDARTTRIGRARVHGPADPSTARMRLESLLGRAELRPSGLPPAAVLCVRRVVDPLPGALMLETADARPPPEWERAFVDALERKLRSAARPAREAVPAAAEAVLFADRAELLACLARDARDGTAWLRWWWRDMRMATGPGGDPVVAAWLETPEHVPAALQLLAAHGEAALFVASLPERAATELVLRVAAAHGLAELRRVAAASPPPSAPPDRPAVVDGEASPPEPPWRRLVPESRQRPLAPGAELLLGVSLVLRREPQLARTSSFAAAARAWLAAAPVRAQAERAVVAAAAPEQPAEPTQIAEPTRPKPTPDRAPAVRDSAPAPEPVHTALPAAPETTQPPASELPATVTATAAPVTASPATAVTTAEPQVVPEAPSPTASVEAAAPPPDERPQPERAVTPEPPRTRRKRTHSAAAPVLSLVPEPPIEPVEFVLETELAGVFYLLNLALYLDLYGDFSRPLQPGLALDPWDLLALLAPRLLDEPLRDDALWRLLARLAGRGPRVAPGRGFRPPRAWRTPAKWLEPFDHAGTWRWSAARDTLRLVHPAGFPVVAVPRTQASPYVQLERELRKLHLAPALRRTTLPAEPAKPLARWTNRLADYADARLRRALALDPDASLDALLLRRHARVFVTSTHVDVTFRLADLPLEVRFAGLDRTPGWIPATGRFVAFHFA